MATRDIPVTTVLVKRISDRWITAEASFGLRSPKRLGKVSSKKSVDEINLFIRRQQLTAVNSGFDFIIENDIPYSFIPC